jgi:hypothetical protein
MRLSRKQNKREHQEKVAAFHKTHGSAHTSKTWGPMSKKFGAIVRTMRPSKPKYGNRDKATTDF